jgi:hypothetical protein
MDRSEQMQLANQAQDDMQAALFHNEQKVKTDASGEPSPASVKSQAVVNIDRIQLLARVDKKEAKRCERAQEIQATYDNCKSKAERIKTSNVDRTPEADGVIKDLDRLHTAASIYLDGEFKEKLGRLREQGKAAQSADDLKEVGIEMASLWKVLNKGSMEDFIDYCKRFNQASSAMNRATKPDDAESKKARLEAPRPPLFTSLFEGVGCASFNCTTSIFEAKGGIRPAALAIANVGHFNRVQDAPVMKKALKSVASGLKGGAPACTQPMDAGKSVMTKFSQTLGTLVGTELMTKCALPRQPWSEEVFKPELIGCSDAYANVFWSPFGMISVNLVMSGDVCFLGIPSDKVPGLTFKDKRATLMRSTVDDLVRLRAEGGFFMKFIDGTTADGQCMFVIPSGFAIVMAARNLRSLRWPIVADDVDTARVKYSLTNMVQSFAEYRSPDCIHLHLAEHFGLRLV